MTGVKTAEISPTKHERQCMNPEQRRLLIVALLWGLLIVLNGPDLRRCFGHPLGLIGISFNPSGVVSNVDPRASRSDIRLGDRIDLSRAPFEHRTFYYAFAPDPGMRVTVPLIRGDRRFAAQITTFAEGQERIRMVWLRVVIALLCAVLLTMVLLRRPSVATWAFFILIFLKPAPVNEVYLLGPSWWRIAAFEVFQIQFAACGYGALFFALHLLHPGPLPAWRRSAQLIAVIAAIASIGLAILRASALMFGQRPEPIVGWLFYCLVMFPILVAPPLLLATYFESPVNLRERLRWIIAGFSMSAVFATFDYLGITSVFFGVIHMSYVTHSMLICGIALSTTLPVAYAILKHRIIDVNVAISRATVYTALSVGIVGAFALIDLFFTRALALGSAGLIADIGLALALGFSFNSLHRCTDAFVDRVLFRTRHLAEQHVAGLVNAMAYAQTDTQAVTMLIEEPVRAFELTGGKLLSDVRNGPEDVQTLASVLEASREPARLPEGHWKIDAVVSVTWVPAIAVPLFSHNKLDAIAIYGLHVNGTDLDADEIGLLGRLATAAGVAFDRLRAATLQRQNELLTNELQAVKGGVFVTR